MREILIADAGSTKTDWSLLRGSNFTPFRIRTRGINPAHISEEEIVTALQELKNQLPEGDVSKIRFYGAGCASSSLCNKIKTALETVFKTLDVEVNSDLLGAAIALFDAGEGIAAILGTGSATGFYENGEIKERTPSLGFILGDEGSGSALGKRLLNAVFKKQISQDLSLKFFEEYQLGLDELIRKVYLNNHAAAYMASFSPFLLKNLDNEEIYDLVEYEFNSFFVKNIAPYHLGKEINLGMVGSIAYNFEPVIRKTAEKHGIIITKIMKEPMPSLENFFSK